MAIAFVQSAGSSSLKTIAFAGNNTAGNLLVAMIGSSGQVDGVSDSRNTYAKAVDRDDAATIFVDIWYSANCGAGANTVTFTGGFGGGFDSIAVAEFSGVATTSPLDQTNNKRAFGNSTEFTNAITTTEDDELIIVNSASDASSGLAWNGVYTDIYGTHTALRTLKCAYRIVSSTGSYDGAGTAGGNPGHTIAGVIASFKAAAAPPETDPPQLSRIISGGNMGFAHIFVGGRL